MTLRFTVAVGPGVYPVLWPLKNMCAETKWQPLVVFNVFLRDDYTCQYCGSEFETRQLTFDHVIPRAHGGTSTWHNVVSACGPCNHRKGSHLPKDVGMLPLKKPAEPTSWQLYVKARKMPQSRDLHETWRDYLYWDTELEP